MKKCFRLSMVLISLIFFCCKNEQNKESEKKKQLAPEVIDNSPIVSNQSVPKNFVKKNLDGSVDGYWNRDTYYKSVIEKEYYYHPRVHLTSKGKVFCFFGIKHDYKKKYDLKDNNAYLYVLDESRNLSVIDTLPMINSFTENFISRQYTNLIVKNGTLYYYKEVPYESYEYEDDASLLPEREYFSYNLEQNEVPIKIPKPEFIDEVSRITYNANAHVNLMENTDEVALLNDYDIRILKADLWHKIQDSLYTYPVYKVMENLEDQVVVSVNKFPSFSHEFWTEPCEANFGGMDWDAVDEILYFDNSGLCYACIWKLDMNKKQVTKIVPEHEAIHPFHFRENNNLYVAYVYKGQLQIAEPNSQTVDIPLNIKTLDPYDNQLVYHLENLLEPVYFYDTLNDSVVEIAKGEYFMGSESSGIEMMFSVDEENKITGSYRYETVDVYDESEYSYENESGVKFTRLQIENSKVISVYLIYEDNYTFLEYNYLEGKAKKETFTLNNKLKNTSNYLIVNEEYNGDYLTPLTTNYYNDKGVIVKSEDHVNDKTRFYDETGALLKQTKNGSGITYVYNENQEPVEIVVNDNYCSFPPYDETMKWHILDKDNLENHLPLQPNMEYNLYYEEDINVNFKTNQNALIEGEIIRKNKGELEEFVEVVNSVVKTWKRYKDNKLIFEGTYHDKDSVFKSKSYEKNDSLVETHMSTFLHKKNRFKKVTKTFYKSGRYDVVDEISGMNGSYQLQSSN
ncbi:hypothetical protein [Pseudotamlana agarivorans]|uniref:hypothetical protein n=1 Tax=Pseudotamlana agarivorans TaxID=481183 RepID=UPI000832FB58|nr:hypothetical protein [Tamlana agarivorans]